MNEKRLGRAGVILKREGYSEREINQLLGKPHPKWKQARADYLALNCYHRWWQYTKNVEDAVIAFAKENGRWPHHREWRLYNGLPSWNTARFYGDYRREPPMKRYDYAHRTLGGLWAGIAARGKELTPALIMTLPNLTARRDAIEAFGGIPELLAAGGGQKLQQDDYGTIWRLDNMHESASVDHFGPRTIRRESVAHYVEVVNSTVNPDGTYDHYFLRVPPWIFNAKDAVAWTGHFERDSRSDVVEEMTLSAFEGFVAQS